MAARLLLLLLLACPLGARALDLVNLEVAPHRAARVQSQVEGAFEHVRARTGLSDDLPLQLVLVGGARRFAEIAAADGVSMNVESVLGYAIPSRRRVVLNFSAMDDRGLEPLGVLRHEVAHLVLGSAIAARRPLWLEEGVANYVENIGLNALREAAGSALLEPGYAGLDDLSAALRDGRAGHAYPESRRVVQLIVSQWGEAALFGLLDRMAQGAEFDDAFAGATGANVAAFETRWLEHRRAEAGSRALMWLGANWSWLLFASGGAVLVLAIVLRRRRNRAQIATWDEQSQIWHEDPAWSYVDPDEGYSPDDDHAPAPK